MAVENHTGAMIALVPSEDDLALLPIDGYEPPEELHCTLYFLGEAADMPLDVHLRLLDLLGTIDDPPIDANVFGVNLWNPTGDSPSWNLAIGDDRSGSLQALHRDIDGIVRSCVSPEWIPPAQHAPWVAHICLAYAPCDEGLTGEMCEMMGPIRFDRIRFAFGGRHIDFKLDGTEAGIEVQPDPALVASTDAANPYHDDSGRFTHGPGGPAGAGGSDVDGGVEALDVSEIRRADHLGWDTPEADATLNTIAEKAAAEGFTRIQPINKQMAPMQMLAAVDVQDPDTLHLGTFEAMREASTGQRKNLMPEAFTEGTPEERLDHMAEYAVTHEAGHRLMAHKYAPSGIKTKADMARVTGTMDRLRDTATERASGRRTDNMFSVQAVSRESGLSNYGAASVLEAYAETYASFRFGGDAPITTAYAELEGWER